MMKGKDPMNTYAEALDSYYNICSKPNAKVLSTKMVFMADLTGDTEYASIWIQVELPDIKEGFPNKKAILVTDTYHAKNNVAEMWQIFLALIPTFDGKESNAPSDIQSSWEVNVAEVDVANAA